MKSIASKKLTKAFQKHNEEIKIFRKPTIR